MLASVPFRRLLVLVRDNKVVDNALYCCRLVIKVVLMRLEALLAPKEDKPVAQVNLLAIGRGSKRISFNVVVMSRV